jgi:hypothetical protein
MSNSELKELSDKFNQTISDPLLKIVTKFDEYMDTIDKHLVGMKKKEIDKIKDDIKIKCVINIDLAKKIITDTEDKFSMPSFVKNPQIIKKRLNNAKKLHSNLTECKMQKILPVNLCDNLLVKIAHYIDTKMYFNSSCVGVNISHEELLFEMLKDSLVDACCFIRSDPSGSGNAIKYVYNLYFNL